MKRNAKISAVRSLADICFLHDLIRLIRCIMVAVCVLVFKRCQVFCIWLYKCLVHSYSSFGSVYAYYPQFRFCLIYCLALASYQFDYNIFCFDFL